MPDSAPHSAIQSVPPGSWAVGVSGGADSVALLILLRARPDLHLHVVHLDHQTRGVDSTGDADFVRELAARLGLPCTLALLGELAPAMHSLPANASSRYRAVRIELFRRAVSEHHLVGVILGHHQDDRAETVLQRLLRGSGPTGLAPLEPVSELGELKILRPLLGVGRAELRQVLQTAGETWREDASNASDSYQRNRLRRILDHEPAVAAALLDVGDACRSLRDWVRETAPTLDATFDASELGNLPPILAAESARRWLIARGAPPAKLLPEVIGRLVTFATDAASGPRTHFPGELLICRSRGMIGVEST